MRKFMYPLLVTLFGSFSLFAQNAIVKGRIVDTNSSEVVPNVEVNIQGSIFATTTDAEGLFNIVNEDLPQGEQVLLVSKIGYMAQRIPITIQNGNTINLDPILLEIDLTAIEEQIGIISLTDSELDEDDGTSFNVSGLLSASKDVFLNAAAYDFSATFFRPRGLDNANGKVLINGIEMNKQYNGRPQWGDWGGLNDVQRNREFSMGLKASDYSFGDVAGTTNIMMRASQYRQGGRVSYAAANRSYRGRIMGSYNSGLTKEGWAYSVLVARRYGNEGYQEATLYDANSFFASVEKKINDTHSLNFSAFYTPNRRARSTAITQEVRDLKGIRYNPNWGYQDDDKRSSRVRNIEEPVVMLNHYWNISENTTLNTNVAYQFGKIGNTRLDYGGNRNPAGNYYQRLPSYFLQDEFPTTYDYQQAYVAEQDFVNNGQIDWASLYAANISNGPSTYSIQEDRVDDTQLTLNTILNSKISENILFNGSLNYRSLKSENFAELKDLLGGTGYLDIDNFGEGGDQSNSDLQNPNRIVQQGERYKYNYDVDATVISGFAQAQFKYSQVDFYAGLSASQTSYMRTGLYQNGYFPEENRSLGESEKMDFTNYGVKAGATYKITGRHLIDVNAGYLTKAPTIRNTFANARQTNDIVVGLEDEKIQSVDLSYIFRTPIVKARLTGYYVGFKDQTDIGFFFTQNALAGDDNNAFVQEVVTGMDKRNMGVELGIEAQVLPTFKVKAAAALGQNIYTNNPLLYLAGDDFNDESTIFLDGNDISTQGIREVALKNYHVAGGPERAFQLGFEYRDPEFWFVGVTGNYYSNAYVDVSNLRRASDFYTDFDGVIFNDYDEEVAKELLKQEEIDDYFLVNLIGGKSWKVKDYYVGFFASISNVLNQDYKTGGFEDSRRASYRQQVEEQNRDTPIFGTRYFFGNGTTYYTNIYVRF
ncbi:TonB-dependent receptor [Ulvibacter antarcticus]|uniref:Carboxypeptidase-like protein n=1 Tax=Ulvibacter antarcticus TaxID=442714 RepID=A0A3L9ZGI0_9FLAO|nr:TonB-dependent receptor [Ulvibacter antarcticus]RMA65842.1 carboxypeptidase-like protein [Ulvibacter antarcticus]